MKTLLITGATSGIGKACAEVFANGGNKLILTGRRSDRLEELKHQLSDQCQVETLCFDVRNRNEVKEQLSDLDARINHLDILINNAGLAAGKANIDEGELDDWDQMIDTNVKGLLYVTKALLPLIKKSQQPHIFNIASTAGKENYLGGNVYCASKHAVDALSKSMRIDLLPFGIKVSNIAPGMVDTEFSLVRFKGDKEKANAVYDGFTPLYAKDVASVIHFASNQPKHVNINDLVITCTAQANSFYTHKL
ncbi:MAG: SDR family NAD(P)-dependent oxidoreductase [Bacteroidota bacterium]